MYKIFSISVILWLSAGSVSAGSITFTTVAGTGVSGYNGEKVPAAKAQLKSPYSVAADALGNIYIADIWENRIQKVDASTGLVTTVAGTGLSGYNGDGIPATQANISSPLGVCLDPSGNLYFAEYSGSRIRRVDAKTGLISTVAGTGKDGFNGDGIPAVSAQLNVPHHVAIDRLGRLYIADRSNSRCRRVDSNGIITTVAGGGSRTYGGDGGPATLAGLGWVEGVWVSPTFDIYLAVSTNGNIRKVNGSTGTITTLTNEVGYPLDVVGDCSGSVFVGTGQTNQVFKVDASTGKTTPLGGGGEDSGEAEASARRSFNYPSGVGVDHRGDLLIADCDHNQILLVKNAGTACQGSGADGPVAFQSIAAAPTQTLTPNSGRTIEVLPNPFDPDQAMGGVLMAYQVPTGSTMSVFTSAGVLVAGDLPEVNLKPGAPQEPRGVIAWDGTSLNGEKAPAGIYYYAIQNGGKILRAGRVKLLRK